MDGMTQYDWITDCRQRGEKKSPSVNVLGWISSWESLLKMKLGHWGPRMPGMPVKLVSMSLRGVFARGFRGLLGEDLP